MADMTPLYSLFAIIPALLSGFVYYAHQRTWGTLDITTESVAYNRTQYHDILDWDKHALSIQGEPTMLFSGEFHYWRVPDRERWPAILKQYRSAGMNTIRIYFHWGYHSPDENVYLFDGNRDVDYLLNLCEELGLFVLAAPGPYICAETQGGGYPAWLIAKRDLRIRHNQFMLWRKYDPKFAAYEIQWLNHILPILGKHQITDQAHGKKRCVLAVQIDNELFETLGHLLPVGLRDQMRVLAKAARDAGITVPLFTNDGFEEGGWNPRKHEKSQGAKQKFGIDLYGFDKYVVFPPSSSPKTWLINADSMADAWGEWSVKQMEKSMDGLEKKVRGFGHGAAESPLFVPELQGGWFNHYQLNHTYDTIYNYFGDHYTKILVETLLAQGSSMINLYMVYGGTNWGMLGDPDVYTSYDYSACIREYGYMSSRGRLLRQTILFARSFDPYFTKTDLVQHASVKTSIPHVLNRQRVAVGADQAVEFNFFRNFDRKKRDNFEVSVRYNDQAFSLGCHLPYKTSFIGIGNYQTANGLHLIVSTVPILARMLHPNGNDEVWVVEPNEIGAMAFMKKALSMTGNMQNDVWRQEGQVMILTFEKTNGWTKLATTTGNLYLVGLTGEDAKTLYAEFQEPYWNQGVKRSPAFLAWGADDMFYNPHDKHLEVNYHPSNRNLQVLSFDTSTDRRLLHNFKGVYEQLPLVRTADLKQHAHQQFPLPIVVSLSHWEARPVYFEKLPWQPLMHRPHDGRLTWDSLDYHFTSGHTVYQTTFLTPSQQQPKVKLSLNARHRSTVLLNGRIVGGHTTYSRQLFAPGAKIGPDPWFLGSHTYDLSPYLSREGRLENQLVILVSNFGLHRQAFVMDDVRNPHGIIKATLSGLSHNETQRAQDAWQIAGVDVRKLDNPFNTVGVPDERATLPWTQCNGVQQEKSMYRFPVLLDDGARWMRFRFDHGLKSASASFNIPLRLHLEGQWTGYIYLNDHLMARYYGNGDSPQHDFYIPEGWVQRRKNEVKMLVYTWHDTEAEISIAGWPIDMETGNLLKDHESGQKEYMVWKDQFHVI